MDWIRRNWPDLLIGLALVAVIAGIIATLLNGGTFLPFGQNNSVGTSNGGSLPATSTALPGDSATAVAPGTTSPSTNSNAVIVVPPSIGTAATPTDAASTVGDAVTDAETDAADAVVGAADAVTTAASNAVDTTDTVQGAVAPVLPGSAAADAVTDAATSVVGTVDAVDAATEAASPAEAATSSASAEATAASSGGAYRISVGAFSNPANAENRAATFRDANYPVFTAPQGDLTLVLVGPYDTNAQAQQVAGQISSAGLEPNPIIFELDTGTSTTVSSPAATPAATTPATTSATTATATPAAATTETTTAVTVPPTATQGNYLQVGAYGSVETSMPQRRVLEGLGFTVLHVEEQGLIKLLVGPYDASNLATAQSQLNAQGIESFVR